MMKRTRIFTLLMCVSFVFWAGSVFAASPDEIAAESEAKAAATATTKPTTKMIMEKVDQAAALLKAKGTAALPDFKGKNSDFIFAGTYIWIHDGDGIMLMHPIKYKMEGNNLIGLKDSSGKRFFAVMNQKVKENGSGWVDYMWPKPGEKDSSQKVSYVKGVDVDGKTWIVGCGVYDFSPADIANLVK